MLLIDVCCINVLNLYTLWVKVPEKVYSEIKEICEHERVTISDALYENLTEFIEDYKNFRKEFGEDARLIAR